MARRWGFFARWWRALRARTMALTSPTRFLCDSCRWDYDRACRRPVRPNATICDDYKRR